MRRLERLLALVTAPAEAGSACAADATLDFSGTMDTMPRAPKNTGAVLSTRDANGGTVSATATMNLTYN